MSAEDRKATDDDSAKNPSSDPEDAGDGAGARSDPPDRCCRCNCGCCAFYFCRLRCWFALGTMCGCRDLIANELVFLPPRQATYRLQEYTGQKQSGLPTSASGGDDSSSSSSGASVETKNDDPEPLEADASSLGSTAPETLELKALSSEPLPKDRHSPLSSTESQPLRPGPPAPDRRQDNSVGWGARTVGPILSISLLNAAGEETVCLRPPQYVARIVHCPRKLLHRRRSFQLATVLIRPSPERLDCESTIVYSYGNAANLGLVLPFLRQLAQVLDVNIFAYDYRGYSPEFPKEKPSLYHLHRSGLEAVRFLLRTYPEHCRRGIVLYGQSLGSVPTIYMGGLPEFRDQIKGIVIQSGFTSGLDVLFQTWYSKEEADAVPPKPFYDVLKNIDLVRKVRVPALVLHGARDQDINATQGYALASALGDHLWRFWVFDEGTHHDLETRYSQALWVLLAAFLLETGLRTANHSTS